MAHGHRHGRPDLGPSGRSVPVRTRRLLAAIAAGLALLTVVAMVALWPSDDPIEDRTTFLADAQYTGTVVAVAIEPCAGTTASQGFDCEVATVRLDQGPDVGEERSLEFPVESTPPGLSVGDEIVLNYSEDAEEGFDYQFADRQRRRVLIAAAVLFAVAVVALGRWRGIAALAGLVASIVVILEFVLPAILDGTSPVLVAVVGTAAIAYLALYLAHGFTSMTTVALIGTLSALALTVALSWAFTELADFSGRGSEEAILVDLLAGGIDLSGLVLAGIVIGALGALDDMTVTQASAVAELHHSDPAMPRRTLVTKGLRIGRDHVASTVNTLALAYIGASLPVMLLFVLSSLSLGTIANSEIVAIEILRTLVGSIGLVAAVPITTWLAALVVPAGAEGGSEARPDDDSHREHEARRPGEAPEGATGLPGEHDDPDASFWSS